MSLTVTSTGPDVPASEAVVRPGRPATARSPVAQRADPRGGPAAGLGRLLTALG